MNHKLSLGLAMLPLVPAVQAQEQGRQDGERPNIIFIMSDDHAQQAMSCLLYTSDAADEL